MKPRVYIETTIPSFYCEIRTEPAMQARRDWTSEWWESHKGDYELFSSIAVLEELHSGDHPRKDETLSLLDNVPLLHIPEVISDIIDAYLENYLMPRDAKGDALHLALASYHQCHYLLTWNCSHLANANKFEHIRHINNLLGIYVPILTTPMELIQSH